MTGAPGIAGRSDRELVLAFQAGDEAAYDELYRRHRDRVARVCRRFLNNAPDAEEAAQETFLKAFQALPRFNGQFQVGAWLARIAANVCVDHLRVKSRSHLVALPNEDRISLLERGPEEILVGEHPEIDVAIKDIQPLHADALKMRALDGMSHVEIAGRLDMTPSQVKALLHRARSSFKKAWDKAQGWLLFPIFKARSLDRSSNITTTTSNLAAISAQAPALAERAAASVLIVMVALSGAPGTSAVPGSVADAPGVERREGKNLGKQSRSAASDGREVAQKPQAMKRAEVPVTDIVSALPGTLTSTIEGRDKLTPKSETGGGGGDPDREEVIPPSVSNTPKQTTDLVKETLDGLNN